MPNRKMIFHIPCFIDLNAKSGSSIRPIKMIQAFKDNGYDVDIVMGYAKERKKQILNIKKNIKDGVKYDFLYSESSTMPTLLTEKNHLPMHPFLDFSFFKFCKKHNIKIGLFYRDVYWKFNEYKNNVSKIKRIVAIALYRYDLLKYKHTIDVMYLPSLKMKNFVYDDFNGLIFSDLPPGIEVKKNIKINKNSSLNIFYVGGITKPGGLYDVSKLIDITNIDENINLTICCRKNEWDSVKQFYKGIINDRVKIIHKSGVELDDYYNKADLCSLIFPYNDYRLFAVPIKLFEYLSYQKPIITTDKSAVSEYVEKNDVGFVVNYSDKSIEKTIKKILNNRNILIEKTNNIKKIFVSETWKSRAKKVERDLKGLIK